MDQLPSRIQTCYTIKQLVAFKENFEAEYSKRLAELQELEKHNDPAFVYSVYDSGAEAVIPHSDYEYWRNNSFETLAEAIFYARNFIYPASIPDDWTGSRHNYYGKNFFVEIKKEPK